MTDVSRVEGGRGLKMNHPGPVLDYGEYGPAGGNDKSNGPPVPAPFVLLTISDVMARRIASESARSWGWRHPIAARPGRIPKQREWGLVILVFELGMKKFVSAHADEKDQFAEARSVVYWHPTLWCAAHPCLCHGDSSAHLFSEESYDGLKYDEFISMDPERSIMVPNLPHETYFPVQERK